MSSAVNSESADEKTTQKNHLSNLTENLSLVSILFIFLTKYSQKRTDYLLTLTDHFVFANKLKYTPEATAVNGFMERSRKSK